MRKRKEWHFCLSVHKNAACAWNGNVWWKEHKMNWGMGQKEGGKRIENRRKGGGEVVFWTLRHEPGNPIIHCLNRIGTSLLLETHTHTHTFLPWEALGLAAPLWPVLLMFQLSVHCNDHTYNMNLIVALLFDMLTCGAYRNDVTVISWHHFLPLLKYFY